MPVAVRGSDSAISTYTGARIVLALAFPFLFLVIIVSEAVPPTWKDRFGLYVILAILAAFGWMGMTWTMRTVTYKERARDYVLAARALGASHSRIIFHHILPNTVSVIVSYVPFQVAGGIVALIDDLTDPVGLAGHRRRCVHEGDRRDAVLDKIGDKNRSMDYLYYDLRDATEREESRKAEWLVEREEPELPARALVMPWSRGYEEDARSRKSVLLALLICILAGWIFNTVDLPIPERAKLIEVPERVAKLVREELPLPKPEPEPIIEELEPEPEEPELAEETPPPEPLMPPSRDASETGFLKRIFGLFTAPRAEEEQTREPRKEDKSENESSRRTQQQGTRRRSSGQRSRPASQQRKSEQQPRQSGEKQDSGKQDSGKQDSGRQDSGRQDSGRQDSGRQDSGRQQKAEQGEGQDQKPRQRAGRGRRGGCHE
mgnify:CR=1 FL=1